MSMIDPVTLALVKSALDAGVLRQAAHANNLANAQTEGYRPFKVVFEERLQGLFEADRSGHGLGAADIPAAEVVPDERAEPISADTEVSALSQNALHYQALAKALGKQYGLLSMALSEGRR
jgi:flagellar basal-body rod protein FlgB